MTLIQNRSRVLSLTQRVPTFSLRAFLCGVALLVAGCGKRNEEKASVEAATTWEEVAIVANPKPPSLEQCDSFAIALEQAVAQGNVDAIRQRVDYREIVRRSTAGKLPVEARQTFTNRQMRRIHEDGPAALLLKVSKEHGTLHYFRSKLVNGEMRALFRIILPDTSGLDYLDCVLGKDSSDRFVISDVFVYSSGELLSQSIRRKLILSLGEHPREQSQYLSESELALQSVSRQLAEIDAAAKDGKHAIVLEKIGKLPAAARKDKSFRLLELSAALQSGIEPHEKAIEQYRKDFPGDSTPDLLFFESYVMNKMYDQAHASLARLLKQFERDGYLEHLRSCVYLEQGNNSRAKSAAEAAILKEPQLDAPYWTLILVSVRNKDFAQTLRQLKILEEEFKMELSDVKGRPELAPFLASPQYQEWLKYLAAKKGAADAAKNNSPRP